MVRVGSTDTRHVRRCVMVRVGSTDTRDVRQGCGQVSVLVLVLKYNFIST